MAFTILKYIILLLVCIIFIIFIIERSLRSKAYTGPLSDHFDGSTFHNIRLSHTVSKNPGFREVLRMIFTSEKRAPWEYRSVQQKKPAHRIEGAGIVTTFINHSTVLIQTEGLNIITDPIYSKRASPFSFLGPKRFADPGVAFEDLPTIDIVLISHNHYDHLDIPTLKRLVERDNPRILTSLGNSAFLEKHKIYNSTDLDWWEEATLTDAVSLMSVPAQHFSSRSLSDRNATLWAGYVITTREKNIYFAGDTGFGPFVDQIAEKFPDGFDIGFLPIGAYEPEWFMQEIHTSPKESLAIQAQLKIDQAVGIHFGTFQLARDGQDQPRNMIHEYIQKTDPGSKKFLVPENGEVVSIAG